MLENVNLVKHMYAVYEVTPGDTGLISFPELPRKTSLCFLHITAGPGTLHIIIVREPGKSRNK